MSDALPPLRLSIPAQPVVRQSGAFVVTARFTNVSTQDVRMLAVFDPLPVFFTTSLVREGGGEVDVAGAGKADIPDDEMRSIDVSPGGHLDTQLDLRPWIRGPLLPGRHTLRLTYHNAYGEDCFHGPLTSDPIAVEVMSAS